MVKKPIQIYVNESLKRMIEEAAKKQNMTVAGFIRYSVIEKSREIIEGPRRIT